jgi:hypothetical protein
MTSKSPLVFLDEDMADVEVGMDDKPVIDKVSGCCDSMMLIFCSGDLKDPKGKADYERGYATVLKFLSVILFVRALPLY